METSLLTVLFILAIGAILFVTSWIRADMVGVLIMLALMISGVLTVEESLSGFSAPVVMIIAAMFIISDAIVNTGVAQRLGNMVLHMGESKENRIITLLMVAIGFIGAFMSSTAAMAIFLPITLSVSRKANLNKKRLLMPLSAAALISGMMTLVATTPNLIVSEVLVDRNLAPLNFFSFTPFGMTVLAAAIGFMLLYGKNKLSGTQHKQEQMRPPTIRELLESYDLVRKFSRLRVLPKSPLNDRAVARMRLRENFGIELVGFEKQQALQISLQHASAESVFHNGDVLYVIGSKDDTDTLKDEMCLSQLPNPRSENMQGISQKLGLAEIMLAPESKLIGKKLRHSSLQTKYNVRVIAIRHRGAPIDLDHGNVEIDFGDVLLIHAAWDDILNLRKQSKEFVVLTLPEEFGEVVPARNMAKIAIPILVMMVLAMAGNILLPVVAVLLASVGLIFTGCVDLKTVYRSIDWQTIVLVATILPLATALDKTGGTSLLSNGLMSILDGSPQLLMLLILFLMTTLMGLFISNTATAVILAPIAVDAALVLGIPPHAFAMTVAVACSAAFAMPVSSPVNMLVMEPGGYKVADYIKIGLPLQLLTMIITVLLVWFIYL